MTADVTLGHLTSVFRAPTPRSARSLPLRHSPGRLSRTWTSLRGRHTASTQAVDPLAYGSEDLVNDGTDCESHDTADVSHERTILELSDDSVDDHWALAPEQITMMTWDEAPETS